MIHTLTTMSGVPAHKDSDDAGSRGRLYKGRCNAHIHACKGGALVLKG